MTRYRWVDSRRAEGFLVTLACAVAGVSPSAFYAWLHAMRHGPTPRDLDEAYLINAIIDLHHGSDDTYGAPRIARQLRYDGWAVNRKRIERLMRENGIVGVHRRRKVRTTIPAEDTPPIADLIDRDFDPGRPDVAWCGDITYVSTWSGWVYASVLDLGSRRLLGYSMACHMRTELVTDALNMAAAARAGDVAGVIFHGGSQYMSADYRGRLAELGMQQSVGRTGVCWDNSVAEAFWSSLKRELVHRYRFATRTDARRAIFAWINWYNRTRLHSTLRYLAPTEWEHRYSQQHPHQRRSSRITRCPANGGKLSSVVTLWRYPVKSMLGEELNASNVTECGLAGDRAYALVDSADGKIASAKNPRKWPRMFSFRAALAADAAPGGSLPAVRITLPDGELVTSEQADHDERLSGVLDRAVTLQAAVRGDRQPAAATHAVAGPPPRRSTGRTWTASTTATRSPTSTYRRTPSSIAPPFIC